jgi:hypothetical protein
MAVSNFSILLNVPFAFGLQHPFWVRIELFYGFGEEFAKLVDLLNAAEKLRRSNIGMCLVPPAAVEHFRMPLI